MRYLRFDVDITIQFTTFTTHQHQRKVNNMDNQQIVHPKHCEVIYRYIIYTCLEGKTARQDATNPPTYKNRRYASTYKNKNAKRHKTITWQ